MKSEKKLTLEEINKVMGEFDKELAEAKAYVVPEEVRKEVAEYLAKMASPDLTFEEFKALPEQFRAKEEKNPEYKLERLRQQTERNPIDEVEKVIRQIALDLIQAKKNAAQGK